MKKIVLKICIWLYFLILVVFAFFNLSIYLKWPMYISGYSSLFTSHFNSRYVLVAAVLLVLALIWYKKGHQLRMFLRINVFLAAFILLMQAAFTVVLYGTARKYDAHVAFFRSFKGYEPKQETTESYTYLVLDGKKYDLDVYRPETNGDDLSIPVIFVHGGGFIEGDRSHVGYVARWFTDRGYSFFSISYPLATDNMQTWESAANAVATAMGYVTARAAKFQIDPNRLILAGGSAGGALVMQADLGLRQGFVQPYDSVQVSSPAAVIAFYPPVSLSSLYKKIEEGKNLDLRYAAKRYLGGSPSEYPARYQQLNLIDQLSRGISPSIIISGDIDHVVNVEATRIFVAQAQEDKLPVSYIEIPYGEHVFDANPHALAAQIVWDKVANFLTENGL